MKLSLNSQPYLNVFAELQNIFEAPDFMEKKYSCILVPICMFPTEHGDSLFVALPLTIASSV